MSSFISRNLYYYKNLERDSAPLQYTGQPFSHICEPVPLAS
jgi:hypothetical protein